MYGSTFQIGDDLVWDDNPAPGHEEVTGPFKVTTVEDNDDPEACSCGASRDNGYLHDLLENMCDELPAQWVTVTYKGTNLKNHDGSDAGFCSSWFRKA